MTHKDASSASGAAHSRTVAIDDNSRVGMALLSQAFAYARDAGADVWDFALELSTLYEAGLTVSDLRWLVAKEFAEHGQDLSVYGGPHRSFRRGDGFFFDRTTCVVLTPSGAAFIDALLKPVWNPARRELSLHGTIVKRYRVPAQNQELILSAFDEEGWPEHIDDPLPGCRDIDPRIRLHDAINRLNSCQTNRLLRFRGCGDGTGVCWELRRSSTARKRASTATRVGRSALPPAAASSPRPASPSRPMATRSRAQS